MIQQLKNLYHKANAASTLPFYGAFFKNIVVIGITGTDGKTTTSTILNEILKNSGHKTALITTIGAYINNEFYDTGFHTTTPSSRVLQKYVKKAASLKCKYIILEITSHALDQHRAFGIPFHIGIITNITHEHLDYHKTYENYVNAKAKLLKMSKIRLINKDDNSFGFLKKILASKNYYTYSLTNSELLPKKMKIIGEFNKENALAAATAAKLLGINSKKIKETISNFTPPKGRQELVHEDKFKVIVDFAHTPASFEKVLPALKKETKGRLIHVFGCAGKRDKTKRPYMGNASSKYADIIILTAEDPRGENLDIINTQIMAGFQKDVELFEIKDRRKAIEKAISIAQKNDTIVITGKGHENSINIDGKNELSWNDGEVIKEILGKYK